MFLQGLPNVVVAILVAALPTALLCFQAHRTTTDLISMIARFQGFLPGHFELVVLIDHCHPVAEFVGVVHTVAIGSRAFDEWRGAEIFETGAGT